MLKFKMTIPLLLITLLVTGIGTLAGVRKPVYAARGGDNSVVIFTANWCASCREVVPILHEVAQQNGYQAVDIDVDNQNAPRQASTYGLSIPTTDPPQAFLVTKAKTHRLFDGGQYKFGSSTQIRSTILQNLQQALSR